MKTLNALLVCCLLALATDRLLTGQEGKASREQSCRQFVQVFYDWYVPKANAAATPGPTAGPGFPVALKERPQVFSPTLRQGLRDDHEVQAEADEIVGIDYDPFLFSQDPCERYVARKVTVKADRYFVEVHGVCGGGEHTKPDVVPELAFRNSQWVFLDFHSADNKWGLLENLKVLREDRKNGK